jgi:hypothetical protein
LYQKKASTCVLVNLAKKQTEAEGRKGEGMTALLWASEGGHAETVRVLVELGASVEAFDKVNIHAHALAHTCCIKHVSGIMRMAIIIRSPAYVYMYVYLHSEVYMHIHVYVCMFI